MTATPSKKWLSVIGIGEDGLDGLSPAARRLFSQARLVVGGARHLALGGALEAETLAWPSPLADAMPKILARRGTPVCVLASGDPFFFGVGALIAAHVPAEEMLCLPGPSAFSLAAARLGWSLQDCRLISLHGRDFERIIPELQPRTRILCLSWDETTPPRLAGLLRERGLGGSRIIVMEAMGGLRERLSESSAESFAMDKINPLNLVALEISAAPGSRVPPAASGLPDAWFENDGQLTKREIRAIVLSALAPRRGELLWDVGAGAGSVAIEWMLADPANRAIAIESQPARAERIRRNALALGAPQIEIVTAAAPEAFTGLPQPQAIFVGGGASDPKLLDAAYAALPAGGRIVVNAVTLESEAELIARFKAHGGDLIKIDIARADPLGGFHGWRPARPITQWSATKT
ncbi:bifunctional cobalt-precorrin-7 (C(5))-methyltransferase/cobalt-precorrin-6B (C(15))-methyltransferase [Methylocapsa acidiphila]|uniref:bifunctional cobalt-precorrin-7 (C(5))-methyltransferase/cobalt-precorrin-6B (C(15))-methyltransferase n=1 Tax=Methylocapsa acidiphila TaxID=133552 RepID=UPI000421D0D9|nr:bifunctional cobalt-precorrin-7 (C(5))-methyltransferase/cobalt-precorrin-6B (C(15))-methyltransferase [Methylocapsa acidiphila]